MKEADIKYELFFEMSPDLLCIAGYDGFFKKVNPAVATTLGYSLEELYAHPINYFVHPDHKEMTAQARQGLIDSKPIYNFENKYLTKGGETIWLSWTSLRAERDGVIFAIAKNITEKKRLEADRNALLATLTRQNKDLMKLNYATSIDLKSPVHSLLAIFELIDRSKVSDNETVQLLEVLQYVAEKVRKTLDTHVDQLSENARHETTLEETNFQECLNEVIQSMATIVQTSRTTIVSDFSKLRTVRFNKGYLKSIFLNLITNAIKYARAEESPAISIYTQRDAGVKQLIVADNGSGFDTTNVKDQIFQFPEKFHNNPLSTGIGLYLVHNQVSSLGGTIDIDSKIGEGTKVTLSFKA